MNYQENREHRNSSGVAKAGLTTGIIGTAGFGLSLLSNLGETLTNGNGARATCSEDHLIDRYTLDLEQQLSEAKTQIALRDSNIYTDQKSLQLYQYIDGRFREFEQAFAQQAVQNQATKDSFQLVNERLCCEEKSRKCADNSIVTYVNATFYPKQVADVTTGTGTTAQPTYNPLPVDTCCC